ncbi:MAG: glycyl-radical enzyme activating protein [Dethiobacter sp.]|jgi:pyruvate formate lyase activating enzyme|nr:glycyl-radical enzyme activating protein [Dethiobacter sp.]
MSKKPLILDIKGNSLDDGPGIRSVVFFKGCPLSCRWCHNPESKSPRLEILFDAAKCVACGACAWVCPRGALSAENPFFVDRDRCELCMACAGVCPSGALSPAGRRMEQAEIMEKVLRDKPFYDNSGGGVTFSGGEPTLFMPFLAGLLKNLKEKGVHTLIETCGLFNLDRFKALVLPFISTIYFDLKLVDPGAHQEYCGAGNNRILENLARLHTLSRGGRFEIIPRLPLVPGITALGENLAAAAEYLSAHRITRLNLLPYNPLWIEKLTKLGLKNPYPAEHPLMNWLPQEEMEKCKALFSRYGIH